MFELKVAGKKVLIYGTGLFGKWYCENMDGAIGFVDSNKKEDSIYNLPVYNVDEIKNVDYDEVHVANAHIETLFKLFEQGISKDRICIANPKVYEVYRHERGGYVDVTTNLLRTKFDIKKIVESFQFEYCLVKIQKEFPNLYAVALDVDMFCGNTTEAKEELKKIVAQTTDFEYQIKDNFSPYNQGTVVFLYRENNDVFDTAFDLINSYYYRKRDTENFTFSKTLFDDCLKSRELKNINGCNCYVPSEKYDLLIRYMELLKHPNNESKQIRHRSYLKERLAPDQIEEFHRLIDEYVKYDGEYLI